MDAFCYFIEHTDNSLEVFLGTISFLLLVLIPIAVMYVIAVWIIKTGKKNKDIIYKQLNNDIDKEK